VNGFFSIAKQTRSGDDEVHKPNISEESGNVEAGTGDAGRRESMGLPPAGRVKS
jgi:hypothetical protein